MSANLDFNNKTQQASFVSAKIPAWHNSGVILNDAFTSKDALEQGGLDFDVVKIQNQLETGIRIPDSYSLVRVDRANNEDGSGILGNCGKNYHIVQNEDLFSFFDFLVDDKKAIYETAGALGNGERVWIMAKLPQDIVIGNYDPINQYILITNAHTGKHSAIAMVTPVRVVCNNTLNVALKGTTNSISIRHFRNAKEKLQRAHEVLGFSTKYYEELSVAYNKMAVKKVTDSEISKYVNSILNAKPGEELTGKKKGQYDMIMNLHESGQGSDMTRGTLWGLFNAVTEYADHYKVVRGDSSLNGKRAESIWFGDSAKVKQKAFSLAEEMMA